MRVVAASFAGAFVDVESWARVVARRVVEEAPLPRVDAVVAAPFVAAVVAAPRRDVEVAAVFFVEEADVDFVPFVVEAVAFTPVRDGADDLDGADVFACADVFDFDRVVPVDARSREAVAPGFTARVDWVFFAGIQNLSTFIQSVEIEGGGGTRARLRLAPFIGAGTIGGRRFGPVPTSSVLGSFPHGEDGTGNTAPYDAFRSPSSAPSDPSDNVCRAVRRPPFAALPPAAPSFSKSAAAVTSRAISVNSRRISSRSCPVSFDSETASSSMYRAKRLRRLAS